MRFLNGFILIGIILLFISIAGLVKGNTLLTEPGQPPNPFAWLEYLAAAVLMLINGAVSIWSYRQHEDRKTATPVEPTTSVLESAPAAAENLPEVPLDHYEPTVVTISEPVKTPDNP